MWSVEGSFDDQQLAMPCSGISGLDPKYHASGYYGIKYSCDNVSRCKIFVVSGLPTKNILTALSENMEPALVFLCDSGEATNVW